MIEVDSRARRLRAGPLEAPCAIGRGGVLPAKAKREGDGATPLGCWPVRAALLRPGAMAPPPGFALPWRWIGRQDGWSDDPADPAYNRPVSLPHPWSAEHLWREDGRYDALLALGHNDAPPVPGRGSAIFLHLWNEGAPTEGCIAVSRATMAALLPLLRPETLVTIG